jgi:hypothetical protein
MKTMKQLVLVGLFFTTLSTVANDRIIKAKNEGVTITAQDKLVQVSLLNTKEVRYTLNILNNKGQRVFTEVLGSEKSLGGTFDFSKAARGVYTFEFVGSNGKRFEEEIRTGSW